MTVDLAIFGNDPGAIKERLPKMIPMLLRELPKSAELIQQVIDFLPAIFIALPPTTGFPMMLATEFASIFHRNYGNDCGDKPILQKTIQAFIAFAQCSTPTLLAKETRYLLDSVLNHYKHTVDVGVEQFVAAIARRHPLLFVEYFKRIIHALNQLIFHSTSTDELTDIYTSLIKDYQFMFESCQSSIIGELLAIRMQRQSLLNKDIDVLLEMIISHAEGEENAETKFVRHLISN